MGSYGFNHEWCNDPRCEECRRHAADCECLTHARRNVTAVVPLLAVAAIGFPIPHISKPEPCPRCAQYHGSKPCGRLLRRKR